MPNPSSPDDPSLAVSRVSTKPRAEYLRLLGALRAADLDEVCEVFRKQFNFFNVSPVFRRLGEWTDLPSEAEAMLYLVAKWPAGSGNGRGRVLSTALNFLGLPSYPAAPDYNSDLFKPTEGVELLDHFFFCTWPLLYDQRISIMPEFVVHWPLCQGSDKVLDEMVRGGVRFHSEARQSFLAAIETRFGAAGNHDGLRRSLVLKCPYNGPRGHDEVTITLMDNGEIRICGFRPSRQEK